MYCKHCGKEITDDAKFCNECGAPVLMESSNEITITPKKKTIKPLYIALILLVVIAVIIAAVIGRKNQAREEYIDTLTQFRSTSLTGAAMAESVCVLTHDVWYDSIHKNYRTQTAPYTRSNGTYNDDFNDSLRALYSSDEIIEKIASININKVSVDDLYKQLQNPTVEFEKCFDVAEELYDSYIALVNLALSPTGSFNSYTEDYKTADDGYLDAYNKLDIIIPDK